ncbi:TniQ family protein [Rhizobium leguminosarum]|uniref:TniQ family protein n=1 Tax=Rhizobium leguminosarum TaxID=384 RepID=UPI001C9515C2|nr:TniQ family protein [Rhizobium leguminosarum]MBY5438672.1 hypothetical protein [Rhizobium leguminosarum]
MRLPVSVQQRPDEPPLSLASRLALANGYPSLQSFLACTPTNMTALYRGDADAMRLLSKYSGIPAGDISRFAIPLATVGDHWHLGEHKMHRAMRIGRRHRYCARCVVEDVKIGEPDRPFSRTYVRASWLTKATSACTKHRCKLSERQVVPLEYGDFSRFVARNFEQIELAATSLECAEDVSLDRYVEGVLAGRKTNAFLDGLQPYVCVNLSVHIGRFAKRHALAKDRAALKGKHSTALGFEIIALGPERIEAVITSAVASVRPMATELKRFFGSLLRWLRTNAANPDLRPVIDLVQAIAIRCLPLGPGDVFATRVDAERCLHSLKTATATYGIFEDRIQTLLTEAGLIKPFKLTSAQIYFDARQAHEVLTAALDTVTSPEMANALDLSLEAMRLILVAGLIPCVEVPTQPDVRIYYRVRKSDFEAFRSTLFEKAPVVRINCGLVTLASAARKCLRQRTEILRFALDGKLGSLSKIDDTGHLASLRVDWAEVYEKLEKQLPRNRSDALDQSHLLNARKAERRLAAASGTLRELINLGLVATANVYNPKRSRVQEYVLASSIDEFKKEHVSLARLSDILEKFPGKVRADLDRRGIGSLYEPTGRNSRYYLKKDICSLLSKEGAEAIDA